MTTGTYHVVRFAADPGDPVKVLLICADEHDRWCECEPPQGYATFDTRATFDVDDVTEECLTSLQLLAARDEDGLVNEAVFEDAEAFVPLAGVPNRNGDAFSAEALAEYARPRDPAWVEAQNTYTRERLPVDLACKFIPLASAADVTDVELQAAVAEGRVTYGDERVTILVIEDARVVRIRVVGNLAYELVMRHTLTVHPATDGPTP